MSNDSGGGAAAAGVFVSMALAYWLAYALALVMIGAFVVLALGIVLALGALFAYLKGAWKCASEGNMVGLKILTLSPMAIAPGFLVVLLSPHLRAYFIQLWANQTTLGSPHSGSSAAISSLMSLLAFVCIFLAPWFTYACAMESDSSYDAYSLLYILPTLLPWLYLGFFSGYLFVLGQQFGW